MATTVKLDDLKAAGERKYGILYVDLGEKKIAMRPALRLSRAERADLDKINMPTRDEEGVLHDADILDVLEAWARVVVEDKTEADELIDAIGGRLDTWTQLQDSWVEKTQPGEASPSAS